MQEARGPELGTTGRPAPRAEVALLFLVQEAARQTFANQILRTSFCKPTFANQLLPDTRDTGLRPTRRAEVALLFLGRTRKGRGGEEERRDKTINLATPTQRVGNKTTAQNRHGK